MFRLLSAALFCLVATFAGATLVLSQFPDDELPEWVGAFVMPALIFLSIAIAYFLFNKRTDWPRLRRHSDAEIVAELEAMGLIVSESYTATRAFTVGEFEDEGLHYFIDIGEGRTLYLSGQYLYEYEPIADDPELNQPRKFPSAEFTIKRHRTERFVVEIVCKGEIIEPEHHFPSYSRTELKSGDFPEPDTIIADRSYDALVAWRRARSQTGT